jgi:transposase-like protein
MRSCRPALFWKRKFEPEVIVTCALWYLRFCLSLRDLEELMAERRLAVDHTTIWRWTQAYGPVIYKRLQGQLKRKSSTWHMDETFVRIAGRWMCLFRAVDAHGQTVDFCLSHTRDRVAAKLFLQKALANPDNQPPHVFARDGLRSYPAAIRELQTAGHVAPRCCQRTRRYCTRRDLYGQAWVFRALLGLD